MAKIQFSLEAFQEPKGFIKVLILCTSLVSFALLASCSEYPFSSVLFGSSVQTSAEFYVAMGVITFVFCLVDIALYATILHLFNNLYWKIEFFYNILWSFLWLIAASVWAAKRLDTGSISRSCSQKSDASLVFGYLTVFLVLANVWYAFKETGFHSKNDASSPNNNNNSHQNESVAV